MAKATKTKVGEFGAITILSRSDSPYYLIYHKSKYKSTGEKTLKGAKRFAEELHNEMIEKKRNGGFEPVGIIEAMEMAIKRSKSQNNDHRINLLNNATYFSEFLAQKFPSLMHWDEVDATHAEAYVETLVERGLRYKTKRHYVGVITMTARYWNNVKPHHYHAFRVNHPGLVNTDEVKKNFASLDAVRFLIRFAGLLDEKYARVCFALGGLAGLNIMEMALRKVSDFDFEDGLVNITKSKNKFRNRKIPVCDEVMGIVKEHTRGMVKDQYLFVQPLLDGQPAKDYTLASPMERVIRDARLLAGADTATKQLYRIKRLIREIGSEADEVLADCKRFKDQLSKIAPKDMRKSFMNIADEFDVNDRWLQAYVGHASKHIIDQNYRSQDKIHKMRKHVVDVIFSDQAATV